MPSARVYAVQDRRRSSAAGPHGRPTPRGHEVAWALRDEDDEPLCEGCTALYREPVILARCRRGLRRVASEDAPEPTR